MIEGTKTSQTIDALNIVSAFSLHVGNSTHDIEIIPLAGDASTRSYYRVINKNSLAAPLKMSWILQCAESFDLNSPDTHPFLSGQRILKNIGARVPEIIDHAAGRGWVLLEDLGDQTLQGQSDLELYKQALDQMIRWNLFAHPLNPELELNVKNLPQFHWAFDEAKFEFEAEWTAEHLFEKLLDIKTSDFRNLARPNSKHLAARPRFYCHRDYHSRNLMLWQGQLVVIDFQDARMGPLTYDLVSLLWDPYVRLGEAWRIELQNYWSESFFSQAALLPWLASALKEQDQKNWDLELERMKVQRLLKAAGSYASFFNNKGRKDYLPAAVPALEGVRDSLDKILTLFPNESVPEDRALLDVIINVQSAFKSRMELLL